MSSSLRDQQLLAPMSVAQISQQAGQYEFNPLIPLRYWFRTAQTILKEARVYEREGNDQQAYLLLFRHAQLVLVHIAQHPTARDETYRRFLADAQRDVQTNFPKLESLKPRINNRYERHVQLMRERGQRGTTARTPNNKDVSHSLRTRTDPALTGGARPLEAAQNKDLALKLAKRELDRRRAATARRSNQLEESSSEDAGREHDVRKSRSRPSEPDDLSQRFQEIRSRVGPQRPASTPQDTGKGLSPSWAADRRQQGTYQYPRVRRRDHSEIIQPLPVTPKNDKQLPAPVLPPTVPAKVSLTPESEPAPEPSPPPIPSKIRSVPPPDVDEASTSPGSVTPSESSSPSIFTFTPSSYLENGNPLRTIFISPEVRRHFLLIAASNTRRNLETCGILCGTLMSNAFFITKLLIPEQESTSDTCEMVNEGAIFDYCDSEDLMVLGWIHTHPSQTCFMSSRDLHTQSGYQVMLPESIAIVCAPTKDPDWGIFRLTDPPGLKAVLSCTQSGIFHPHAESNVYTDALRPGHVCEISGMDFETIDLRSGKPKVLPRPS